MGAERCIVLLVGVVMITSYFVVNSVVDEDILKNYSEEVAEYNELHDENILDTVMRKRSVEDSGLAKKDSRVVSHSERIRRSSGQGINEDPEHDQTEQSYNRRSSRAVSREESDFPRLKSKRSSGQGIDEDPEHDQTEQSYNRRSSRAVSREESDFPRLKSKRSSGQGIDEDPEHDQTEQSYNRRSSRAVSREESDFPRLKSKRSSGQGIDEDPEHDQTEQSYNRRSSRAVSREESDFPRLKSKRSSGQGIDEDPEHDQTEQSYNRRSSRAVSREESDFPRLKSKRSSGQGIDEDPEIDHNENDLSRRLKYTQNTVETLSRAERSGKFYPVEMRSKMSSKQGINEENAYQEVDSSFLETTSDLDSDAEYDIGAEDEEYPADNLKSPNNPSLSEFNNISEELSDIDINAGSDEEGGDVHIEASFPDSVQPETMLKMEEFIQFQAENGHDGDSVSHSDNILNPYEYNYEQSDLSSSDDMDRLLFNFAKDSEKIIKLNKGIDFLTGLMNTMFTGEGELTVDLPDISKKFGRGLMAGDFNATQGYFKNPATLHRTGDVEITKIGDTVSFEVALGLQVLDAGFQHYDLKILKIHQAGDIDVSIAQNSIKMKISLTYAPACNLTVDYVGLDQLGGIKVNISGLGAFQSMFDLLSKWFLDNFTGDLKNIVNQQLAEKAKKAVAREDICKYFPQ